MGLKLFSTLFKQAKEIQYDVSGASKRLLDKALDNGELVSVLRPSKTISQGEKAVFEVGVTNNLGSANNFSLVVNQSTSSVPLFKVVSFKDKFYLENKERKYLMFQVKAPSVPEGTYLFNVTICYDDGNSSNDPARECDGFNSLPDVYYYPVKVYVNVY